MAKILITGGTGLIGKALSEKLINAGHTVRILSRTPKQHKNKEAFFWDVENKKIDESAFDGIEHIVHLAGEGVASKRWTIKRKKEIVDSRINSMQFILEIIRKKNLHLKSFVGASAVGIYGMKTSEKIFTETDKGAHDFLSHTCTLWENSYNEIPKFSDKMSVIRIGVVLSKNGGALERLLPLFKLGLGSAVGSGKQYMPWIHIDDLVNVFYNALFSQSVSGTYNAVAPQHVTSKQFSAQLATVLSKPFFLPNVPVFALKLVFGEMANVLLEGSRVSSQKLEATGFLFKYPDLFTALKNVDA